MLGKSLSRHLRDGTDIYWARSRVLEYLNSMSSFHQTNPVIGPDATGVGWVYERAVDKSGNHSQICARSSWTLRYALESVKGVSSCIRWWLREAISSRSRSQRADLRIIFRLKTSRKAQFKRATMTLVAKRREGCDREYFVRGQYIQGQDIEVLS